MQSGGETTLTSAWPLIPCLLQMHLLDQGDSCMHRWLKLQIRRNKGDISLQALTGGLLNISYINDESDWNESSVRLMRASESLKVKKVRRLEWPALRE